MHKILGITCSHRHLGNSDVLLKEALMEAKKDCPDIEYLRLSDMVIKPCRGCLKCVYKGTCAILDDDFGVLWEKLKSADGLIIAAPTYLFSPPGIVKMVVDRCLTISKDLDSIAGRTRVAATINVAGNRKWNYLGVEILNLLPLAYGYEVIDYLEAYAPGPGEVLLNPENVNGARRLGARVAKALHGAVEHRQVADGQCPACYSKTFRFGPAGIVECCTCGIKGSLTAIKENWQLGFSREEIAYHFWTLQHRRNHLNGWVIPTRDVYLKKREEIKKLLPRYREIK
jgi:multimeric flavodoxin WrbA